MNFIELMKNYFPRAPLEECKYKVKHKMIKSFTTADLTNSDSNSESEDQYIYKSESIAVKV